MTREEAIKVIHKMLAYTDLSDRANLTADMVDACRLAIKTLDQEPILDKIRAEIVELTKCPYGTECLGANCPSNTDCMICGDHVLDILDKYKAETEVGDRND